MPDYISRDEQVRLGIEASECNKEAFAELHKHFHQALCGHIRGRIGNSRDAEDLAQETWEYCLKKKDTYNPKFSFFTFLLCFARYIIARYYKRTNQWNELFIFLSEFPELKKEIQIIDLAPPDSDEKAISTPIPSPYDSLIFRELLCISLKCCAKPHKLVTFGFHRPLQWKPSEIAKGLSNRTLKDLSKKLYQDYISSFRFIGSEIAECFTPLFSKLEQLVEELYTESEYQELRKNYSGKKVGSTELRVYLRKDPAHSISDWSNRVKNRVKEIAEGTRTICLS